MSIDSLSTSTLDDAVLASIRQDVADFLHRCGLQYKDFMLDEALYAECLQEAINRGFPMDGEYSIRAHMANGVSMLCAGYAHLSDRATRMWICLITSVGTRIDDIMDNGINPVHLYSFNENCVNCRPHGNPLLDALDELMREAYHHYSPLVTNMTSPNFISGIMLEHGTNSLNKCSLIPQLLKGLSECLFIVYFPLYNPVSPIHLIYARRDIYREHHKVSRWFLVSRPNLPLFSDILSYYKEEMEGETERDALHGIIEKTMQAHHNILGCLKPCPGAYDAYLSFFYGYINYHAAPKRYKLEEIILEASSA